MTETMLTVYPGGLRTEATHVKSGYGLITDVPLEHGGRGESFSPTDLFCASLVSSMLSAMGGVARNPAFGGTIDGTRARTTKTMKENPHSVAAIVIEFDMPSNNYSDEQKKLLEAAARNSQVGKGVHPDLEQTLIFNY
jgi:putative redox protein